MSYIDTLPKVQELVNNLLIVLSEKEKFIIENRFSLNDKPRMTLETIGQKYNVTRERIRQIEKNALRKLERNVNNTLLHDVTSLAKDIITEYGGIIEEDRIIKEIQKRVPECDVNINSLKLTIGLEKEIEHMHNTIQYRPYWKFSHVSSKNVKAICQAAYKILRAQGEEKTIACDKISGEVLKQLGITESIRFVCSSLELDRRIKVLDNENVGLTSWRSINPRTLRDKIFFVLKETRKPLHYVDIANKISSLRFDSKNINTQAVHNELIRHDGFVLIGRGIYALKEWGYEEGTVSDVIKQILEEHGELKREQIIEEVLKRRQVKKITIQLNLKNKPEFERVGRDTYKLKK